MDEHPKPKLFTLNRGQLFPEKMLMTDYRFDGVETWWPWLKSEEISFNENMQISNVLVPTKETNIMQYWLNLAVKISLPIIIVSDTATAKSKTLRHFLNELPKDKFIHSILNVAANSQPKTIQEIVMAKLDRRRKGVFGPPVGKLVSSSCIFIPNVSAKLHYIFQGIICGDNLSIPVRDKFGTQPSIELLRQWIDHNYWVDLNDSSKIELVDLVKLAITLKLIIYIRFAVTRWHLILTRNFPPVSSSLGQ